MKNPEAGAVATADAPPSRARLTVELENVRNTHGKEHPLFGLRAILLNGWGLGERKLVEPAGWTFRPAGPLASRVRQGARYISQVVLPPGPDTMLLGWRLWENVEALLSNYQNRRSFSMVKAAAAIAHRSGVGSQLPDSGPEGRHSSSVTIPIPTLE